MSDIQTPKQKLASLLEGILLGRTLHDLEKQAGASVEQLLQALKTDEQAFVDFKTHREFSAFVIEDEITERLRANMEAPASAVQNNALKVWADHMHWVAERRNPAIYSGKAALHMTVPVQIITDLDLNAPKNIEGIYDLEAIHVEERSFEALAGANAEVSPGIEAPRGAPTPFSSAILEAEVGPAPTGDALDDETGPDPARRHPRVGKREPVATSGEHEEADSALEGTKPRAKGRRARKNTTERGAAEGETP